MLSWDLPKKNLDKIASNLKWIHCIGAGVEHLYPFNWLPKNVVLTNNKGVHSKKAGEYGLMAILMLHNHFQKIIKNQFKRKYDSIYSTPIEGKNIVIHCMGGKGRSGTIAAILLIEFGDINKDVINKVREKRKGAIETKEQENFILSYRIHT